MTRLSLRMMSQVLSMSLSLAALAAEPAVGDAVPLPQGAWKVTAMEGDTLRVAADGAPAPRRGIQVAVAGRTFAVAEAAAGSAVLVEPRPPTQSLGAFIVPVDATASSFQPPMPPQKTIDGSGWSEWYPGSGVWQSAAGSWHGGGMVWTTGNGDSKGWISFDLGAPRRIDGMYVWNYNEGDGWATRGLRGVIVATSSDNKTWKDVGQYPLAQASGRNDERGQAVAFGKTVAARYVRLTSIGNYRDGEQGGLSEVRFSDAEKKAAPAGLVVWKPTYARPALPTAAQGTPVAGGENMVFPAGDHTVIDLSKPPYGLTGDGVTDVTAILNRALDEQINRCAILYLPNGVYVVSDTVRWGGSTDMKAGNAAKFTALQGQSRDGTVIRLRDACPGYEAGRKPVVWTGAAPAQRFANEVRNLTIDTGVENPGAAALQFIANNQGGAYDLLLRSGDGQGAVGLDLGYTDEQGPSLMARIRVQGFDVGVWSATAVASYAMEDITVERQNVVGFRNDGQPASVRRFTSRNAVPAVINGAGLLTLLDSELIGTGAASSQAAVTNVGALFARNLVTRGYRVAIDDKPAAAQVAGPKVAEHRTPAANLVVGNQKTTLNLPIQETPTVPWDEPATWALPERFGAKIDDGADDAPGIQAAIDSGATTVFLGRGGWNIGSTIELRGNVRRVIGGRPWLMPLPSLANTRDPMFRLGAGVAPVVQVERLATSFDGGTFVFFEHNAARTLVLRQIIESFQGPEVGGYRTGPAGTGDLFLEDVCVGQARFTRQRVWARQLNCEGHGTKVINDGGAVWVLGFKSEKRDILVQTIGGGRTEMLGGLMQTSDGASQEPMFDNRSGAMSVVFAETNNSSNPYELLVRHGAGGNGKELRIRDPGFRGLRAFFYEGR